MYINKALEPISHFFYSDRLRLQFWDYGQEGKPPLMLVHGGLDHSRSWDAIATEFSRDYRVYAYDLRGHGNSDWAPGAMYSMAEHVLDLTVLIDIVNKGGPMPIVGHSLGGMIVLHYAGLYPDRVSHVVSIEGIGFPPGHRLHGPASERLRKWIESVRGMDRRTPKAYANLESAVARMKEANPRLSDEMARRLTLHGTNWNAEGALTWKFDNYFRAMAPYGHHMQDAIEIFSRISCPALFFWGLQSFAPLPDGDPRYEAIRLKKTITAPEAGHWVHHDERQLFLRETAKFLAEDGNDPADLVPAAGV